MIGAILGIIFHNDYQGFLPDGAVAQIVNEQSCGQVIVGNLCKGSWHIQAKPHGVIVNESDCIELRDRIYCQKRIKILFPFTKSDGIADGLDPGCEIPAEMIL